jgi:hypothetical protein
MFGYVMGLLLIVWMCITLIALGTTNDVMNFMRGIYFPILCVGYIVILAVYFMFKDVFREERD